jgi:uncharacterized protein YkwD
MCGTPEDEKLKKTPLASRVVKLFAAISAVVTLSGCGGGGSSSAAQQATNPVTVPAPSPAPAPSPTAPGVNTAPQVATYPAGSPEAAAFATLNAERGSCGFGFLKQSAKLDISTGDANTYFAARAAESIASAQAFSHVEDGGKTGFTGAFPWDRAEFRGYGAPADVAEDNSSVSFSGANAQSNLAISNGLVTSLLTSVYHLSSLMAPRTELGLAFVRTTSADHWDTSRLNMTLGIPAGDARQVSTAVRTYPCQGTTQVAATFKPANESPNPAPDLGAAVIGTPIYVNGPEGQTLDVTTATVTATAGGAMVPSRLVTRANEPVFTSTGVHGIALNEAFVLPTAALTKGTSYTVTVTGNSNGTAFTKTYTFVPSP